ncbi:MAG: D-alanyl-D-alanine carboxypeptidase/D-alanyl-D-alanine-endopeptidase [Candidatus Gastranaerophilales bacterium]|nr:D-alanyl-D-alanine carboxypeptidase/D-alanyl-D-alanine-endopeptidase [Candidatus Gastranaerophilales bacterium]
MKKLTLLFLLIFGLVQNISFAADLKGEINSTISHSGINKGAVSISLLDASNGKNVFSLNPKTPISPASIQKIVTSTPAFITLGDDYRFATKLYKNKNDDYLIVLGADPYLKANELDKIVRCISKEPNSIAIDDSVIDKNEWGEGWQWDDDLNPLMPKFSAYNIDKNLMEVVIIPSTKGFPADIKMSISYPTTFVNEIITDKQTDYTLTRQNYVSPDVIIAKGTIEPKRSAIIDIPVNNPKKYFKIRLSEEVINHSISSSGVFPTRKLNKDYTLITLLSHDIKPAQSDILKESNNLVAETVFKLAGGKFKNQTGSFENGLEMFNDFCKKQNIDTSNIKLTDASGVSKNNLMTADFMTEFLYKNQSYLENKLTTAGEGTLSNRMLYLKNLVHAKTGTLNNISSIAGYITTRTNKKYIFCIMINDSKTKASDKKMLEEYILRTIYSKG